MLRAYVTEHTIITIGQDLANELTLANCECINLNTPPRLGGGMDAAMPRH